MFTTRCALLVALASCVFVVPAVGAPFDVQVTTDAADYDWSADWQIEPNLRGTDQVGIFLTITLTNMGAVPADFMLQTTSNSAFDLFNTMVTTSFSANLQDDVPNGNGATLTNNLANDPIYTALLNNVVVDELGMNFNLIAPPNQTASSPTQSNVFSPGPDVSIGDPLKIELNFRLSPFDTAQITSTFVIVPEPATALLLASGGLVLVRRRTGRA